jgi:hypothetical protein
MASFFSLARMTIDQIKKIGTALLSYLKEKTNPALAKGVVDSIPSLRERFGHLEQPMPTTGM